MLLETLKYECTARAELGIKKKKHIHTHKSVFDSAATFFFEIKINFKLLFLITFFESNPNNLLKNLLYVFIHIYALFF